LALLRCLFSIGKCLQIRRLNEKARRENLTTGLPPRRVHQAWRQDSPRFTVNREVLKKCESTAELKAVCERADPLREKILSVDHLIRLRYAALLRRRAAGRGLLAAKLLGHL
jgi:hypothetical protein